MTDPECVLKWVPVWGWEQYVFDDNEDPRLFKGVETPLRMQLCRAIARWYYQARIPSFGAVVYEIVRQRPEPFRSVEEFVEFVDRQEVMAALAGGWRAYEEGVLYEP